jgi:hypothetical protein
MASGSETKTQSEKSGNLGIVTGEKSLQGRKSAVGARCEKW